MSEEDPKQIVVAIESLLQNMQDRFSAISEELLSKIDEMSSRIDTLESTLNELVSQADMEGDVNTNTTNRQ